MILRVPGVFSNIVQIEAIVLWNFLNCFFMIYKLLTWCFHMFVEVIGRLSMWLWANWAKKSTFIAMAFSSWNWSVEEGTSITTCRGIKCTFVSWYGIIFEFHLWNYINFAWVKFDCCAIIFQILLTTSCTRFFNHVHLNLYAGKGFIQQLKCYGTPWSGIGAQ